MEGMSKISALRGVEVVPLMEPYCYGIGLDSCGRVATYKVLNEGVSCGVYCKMHAESRARFIRKEQAKSR